MTGRSVMKMDHDGLLLCEIQAKTFELSVDTVKASSPVFIRRFMNSNTAERLDDCSVLDTNLQPADLLDLINEQYGLSDYGSVKYTHNEMYWIGYIYRYYAYMYQCSSSGVYRLIKPKELRDLYLPYHTMDPAQAIERIQEAKGISGNMVMDTEHQYDIFRRIRNSSIKQ